MTQTRLLAYLIERMKDEGLIRFDKQFLAYCKISEEQVTSKQLSSFLSRSGEIRNSNFLRQIESMLNLPRTVWGTNEERQIEILEHSVSQHKKRRSSLNNSLPDISAYIPTEAPMTDQQAEYIASFHNAKKKKDAETLIDGYLSIGLLDKKLENQQFIVEIIKQCYEKGLYLIIIEFLLPKLYRPYRNLLEIQKIEAHTRGSLGEYDEAKHILHLLIHQHTIENINLRTSALSNHKREILQSDKKVDMQMLCDLVQGYQKLFDAQNIYSYYTGINLLYVTTLGQILFPESLCFHASNPRNIYRLSKASLKQDRTHAAYYTTMCDLEFRLLLGYEGVFERIESFLANQEPHYSLVERTLRQMKLFVHAAGKNGSSHPLLQRFAKSIQILEGYCQLKNI